MTAALAALVVSACGTVDPGDNFVAPNLMLDEDFFYCVIQPEVIARQTCASGGPGEAGMCHASRTSLDLDPAGETDPPPACADNAVTGAVPLSYENNFLSVQTTVQSDPLSSPFYRRPTGLDSHPRIVFSETSPEAMLVFEWINSGAM